MNGLELLVLGRTLMKLAGTAMPTLDPSAGSALELPASVRSVLLDVTRHPGSSVGEIAARTGFPQSHVSASIARLEQHGSVSTSPDPRDRRRTLVRLSRPAAQFVVVSGEPADDALRQALDDPRALPEVQAALRTLYSHLVRLP